MAMPRLSMQKTREILRLRFELGLTHREIAESVGSGRTAVGDCLARFGGSSLEWPKASELSDSDLVASLYGGKNKRKNLKLLPDWNLVAQEMRKKHVTLQLLWAEKRSVDEKFMSYSRFCDLYGTWKKGVDLPFRNNHKVGDKVFVDYAGQTIPIFDGSSKEPRFAQVFVGVLGASNYTYVEATWSQKLPDWIASHRRMFQFFGGVTAAIVPDNLKSGVKTPCRYDPEINPTYHAFAKHYNTAVIPARSYKPKDKAKAEGGVLIAGRWIFAALRNHKFFSLDELNAEINILLDKLNQKQFQKLSGNRAESFEILDKPYLKPLPQKPFEISEIKFAKVNIDYHIEISKHYYSVPYQLVGKKVEVRITNLTIEIFSNNKRVISHKRKEKIGGYTTLTDHMPPKHKAHVKWSPERMVSWVGKAGPSTTKIAQVILKSREHPEQNFKRILGMIRLGKKYGDDRLEAASFRALRLDTINYRSLKNILEFNLDKSTISDPKIEKAPIEHSNIRGPEYFN